MTEIVRKRKETLIQDFNAQKVVIERMETELATARVTLSRLEGALLLCDELLRQPQAPAPPDQAAESKKNGESADA